MDFWEFSCMSLGAAFVVYYGLKLILFGRMLLPNFFFPLPKSFFSSMGEWAVVTGASEGIGRAYAFALAERGLNVVIISRTKEKLDKVAQKISDTTDQKVKVLVADFTKDNAINSIEDELKGMNIGVLVNNVAMLVSTLPEKFLASPNLDQVCEKKKKNTVKGALCNISVREHATCLSLGSGVIINISSGAAAIPFPLYTLYSASKIFVERVSQGLQVEYKDRGIIIQAVAPYSVSTQMNFYQPTSTFVLSPEDFVSSSLQYLRVGDRIYGSLIHTMMGWLLKTLPRGMLFSDSMQKNLQEYVRIQNQNGSHKTQALQ
ncbi:hypothetical protein NQD34_006702 [Periophthalmus magnuspinnatus]|nr:hypothetical protein NQD34_006702 [Periophthalmus magnuspinnatus]